MNAGIDILLPHEWYDHMIQTELIKSNIKMPVVTTVLKELLIERDLVGVDEHVPSGPDGVSYVPGIGDEFLAECYRRGGNPLEHNNTNVIVLISPPLYCFDNTHWFGSKVITDDYDNLVLVAQKDNMPGDFQQHVSRCISHIRMALDKTVPNTNYEILGTRLNQLTSGMRNLVCYVKLEHPTVLTKHMYVDTSEIDHKWNPNSYSRTRLIPKPCLTSNNKCFLLKFSMKDTDRDNGTFLRYFDNVQDVVNDILPGLSFKHLKMNKNENKVVVCLQDPSNTVTLDHVKLCVQSTFETFNNIFYPNYACDFACEEMIHIV